MVVELAAPETIGLSGRTVVRSSIEPAIGPPESTGWNESCCRRVS